MSMLHRFFDGQIAKPHDVTLALRDAELEIVDASGRAITVWPLPHIRVSDQNAVSGSLTLRLDPDRGARLEVAPGEDQAALLSQRPELRAWRRRERVGLLKGFVLWGGLGAALLGGVYFGWSHAAVEIAAWMPLSWEDRIGAQIEKAIFPASDRCTGAEGIAALQALGKRIWPQQSEGPELKLFVLKDSDSNAFAVPGRRIVVFSGLIEDARNPEMLAAVLAHEMAHVELRHPVRGLVTQLGLGAVITLIFGDSSLAGLGHLAIALSYSRDMEREADQRGIALLKEAGMRADGMAAFFEEFKKDGHGMLPIFLSTHPDLEERIAATKQPPTGDPAMSETEWKALKAVCARE